mgnify:CR=1 FL=1
MSFLSPKTPSVPQPTPPPSRGSTADAAEAERRRAAAAQGRNSTILTGSLGTSDGAAPDKRKTLLGAG